jgi:hypothetical protein
MDKVGRARVWQGLKSYPSTRSSIQKADSRNDSGTRCGGDDCGISSSDQGCRIGKVSSMREGCLCPRESCSLCARQSFNQCHSVTVSRLQNCNRLVLRGAESAVHR